MPAPVTRRALLGGAVATAAGGGLVVGASSASAAPNYPGQIFPTLSAGMSGLQVRALRYLLYQRGHNAGIANTYDSATVNAVKAFQARSGLAANGICADSTFRKLIGGVAPITYNQTNNFVVALQQLLIRHGYQMDGTSYYGAKTRRNVWSFQVGHGIQRADAISLLTWSTLFHAKSSGAMYPMMQRDTGNAQWSNCGPVAAMSLLIHQGKTPSGWTWNVDTRRTAIENFRYGAMELARTSARDKIGTEYPDFVTGLGKYGMSLWHGGIEDTLNQARMGRPSIAGGDVYKMPYPVSVSGPVSHWVTVLGYDGSYYIVHDPISQPSADYLHRVTATQLRTYASTNPGHPPETAKQNSILLR